MQEHKYHGRPAKRGHIPFGYRIEKGRAVINEKEAEQIRQIFTGYLSGLSLIKAAKEAGLTMTHSSVKNLLHKKCYLGDDFYPGIIDKETFDSVEQERLRRLDNSPVPRPKRKTVDVRPVQMEFILSKPQDESQKCTFQDPYEQAEYVYSRIISVDTIPSSESEKESVIG